MSRSFGLQPLKYQVSTCTLHRLLPLGYIISQWNLYVLIWFLSVTIIQLGMLYMVSVLCTCVKHRISHTQYTQMHNIETVSRLKQTHHPQCGYVWWVWADKSAITIFVTCSHWRGRSMSGLYSCSHQRGRLFMIHVSNSLDDFCL